MVIGRRCKNVARAEALDYVLGYTCANDVSARDWQSPLGRQPVVPRQDASTPSPRWGRAWLPRDEIPNPNALQIKTLLNGQVMQDGNTSDMIFDVPALIEFLSGSTTLLPGTVILTGTPQGRGHGPQAAGLAPPGRHGEHRVGEGGNSY